MLNQPFDSFRRVWVEISKSNHGHGGVGWEFGTCLWSPSRDRGGKDKYAIMREPALGDLILHLYEDAWDNDVVDRRLCGYSIVKTSSREVSQSPPLPGDWAGMSSYVRIDLEGYVPFENPVSFATIRSHYGDEIRLEMAEGRPKYYPFNTYGPTIRTVQGSYLTRCTSTLYRILMRSLGVESAAGGSTEASANLHAEYSEGLRTSRESRYFTRNPALTRDAKAHYGYVCQACGFDFRAKYGAIGDRFIECHHLNPLAERDQQEGVEGVSSTLNDVTVLCANCHRMVHRHKPAMGVSTLQQLITR